MGSTIVMGALTTAGAGAIMFLCFFYFFFKMAMLICITIMFSFLFSLGGFMAFIWVIGPEGSCGELTCFAWICGTSDTDEDQKIEEIPVTNEVTEAPENTDVFH